MSDSRGSFWSYAWNNTNYKRSRFARRHNNIYVRQQKNNVDVLKTVQNSWDSMTKYIMHGGRND